MRQLDFHNPHHSIKMKTIVYYHDHCTDGFGAAFVVYQALNDSNVEYVPCNYNAPAPAHDDYANKEVIIVDFSFPIDIMKDMQASARSFTWLDHHKTAFEMAGKPIEHVYEFHSERSDIILDNNRSGAMLAYDFFFAAAPQTPIMIQHIDDRDRWQFKIPGSREFHAALQLMKPWTFEQWDELDFQINQDERAYKAFIELGELLLKNDKRQIDSASKKHRKCNVIGYSGLAVNSTVHMSEIGHELANQSETFGLIYYIDADNSVKCSLRSNGDYDVSMIAKFFNGGGHKNAAGFSTDMETLQRFLA